MSSFDREWEQAMNVATLATAEALIATRQPSAIIRALQFLLDRTLKLRRLGI